MNILVIGASGQIGGVIYSNLFDRSETDDIVIEGTYCSLKIEDWHSKLDISSKKSVEDCISKTKPNIVFIPGAITNVDLCEEKIETYDTNVLGVKNIVDSVDKDCKIVFFSTDFVFDGKAGLYSENDIPNPINNYGYQKLLAEHYIANNVKNYFIIRTHGVYGPEKQQKNFVSRLIQNLQAGKEVNIPMDEFGTPTYGPDLAQKAIDLAFSDQKSGIYHICGPNLISRYKFALTAADIFGYDSKFIKTGLSGSLNRLAKRPLSGGLVTNKPLGPMMDYIDGLKAMKKALAF